MAGTSTCPVNSTTIGNPGLGYHWGDFYDSYVTAKSCAAPSYIRPDHAGSILPWPYTIAWFLVHFPVTLIRVHRWERVQALSLILAIMTIAFQLQAYANGLGPEAVLVWMPIFVVLDIGAMMQLVFLIIEDTGFWPLVRALTTSFRRKGRRSNATLVESTARQGHDESNDRSKNNITSCSHTHDSEDSHCLPPAENHSTNRARPSLAGRAWVALLATILGLLLVVLQLYGLVAAVRGSRVQGIRADWCSTLFATSIAVQSGCDLYEVRPSFSQGIGCISIHGYDQYAWLNAAVILISVSLAFQVFDCAILSLVSGATRWRGAKMKRPWFTMFTGNVVLVVLIVVGVFQCQRLPRDVSNSVSIFIDLNEPTVCVGDLTPYGVRGAVIGWTDGFLGSWGATYNGFDRIEASNEG